MSTTPTTLSFAMRSPSSSPKREQPAAHLGGYRHFGRLEVAVGVGVLVAAGDQRDGAEDEGDGRKPAVVCGTHGVSLAVRGVIPRVVRYLDRAWASSTRWRSSVSRASRTSVRDST